MDTSAFEPGWQSVLPALLAILLAIVSRQVIVSLGIGIWVGYCILESATPIPGIAIAIEGVIAVFSDAGDTRVLVFTLVIGGLIATIEKLGGVRGFIELLERRRWVDGPVRAEWLAWATGLVVFIESNITLLVAGSICRPLFDRYRIARERLAYLIDSTSAPVCILIPLNAWGALVIGLLAAGNIENPVAVFVAAIPFNFYPVSVILFSAFLIWRGIDFGPMKKARRRTERGELLWPGATPMIDPAILSSVGEAGPDDRARYMILPLAAMVVMMPVGLYITGNGVISAGSGSTAVLWAVLTAVLAAWLLALGHRRARIDELMQTFLRGAGGLLPVTLILLFALALGDVANALGAGPWVAGVAQNTIPVALLPPLLFLTSGLIAFSIGSSWGTFAIMIPLAMQIAVPLELSSPLFLAAVLSGSVFGDHASPISDTTVVASMASATDHIDHVRTQLPYALVAGAIASAGFLAAGILVR